MQIGFSLLEVGSVQSKSTKNVLIKNFFDFCLSSISWTLIGHAVAFGSSSTKGVMGGNNNYILFNSEKTSAVEYANWLFHWAFVSTACTIVSGAVAERINFRAYFVFAVLLCICIYPVTAHVVWSNDGLMSPYREEDLFMGCGVIDFAGSG